MSIMGWLALIIKIVVFVFYILISNVETHKVVTFTKRSKNPSLLLPDCLHQCKTVVLNLPSNVTP